MSDVGKKIRRLVRELEGDAAAASELREWAKHEVKLTEFGAAIVAAAFECDVPQAVMARVLQVSPSAIARRYAELAA